MSSSNAADQDINQYGPPIKKRKKEIQQESTKNPLETQLGSPHGYKNDWYLRGEVNPMHVSPRGVFTIYTDHGLLEIISSTKLLQQFSEALLKLIVDFTTDADNDLENVNIDCYFCRQKMFASREAMQRMEKHTEWTRIGWRQFVCDKCVISKNIWGSNESDSDIKYMVRVRNCADCHENGIFWDSECYAVCEYCDEKLGYLCDGCLEQRDPPYDHPHVTPDHQAIACDRCMRRLSKECEELHDGRIPVDWL